MGFAPLNPSYECYSPRFVSLISSDNFTPYADRVVHRSHIVTMIQPKF
jgi:hypothetical protein